MKRVFVALAALLLVGCAVPKQTADIVTTVTQGGMTIGCDLVDLLYPDKPEVSKLCRAGSTLAMAVLSAAMYFADSKHRDVSTIIDLDTGPTLYATCGEMQLRCDGLQLPACDLALERCDLGVPTFYEIRK